MALNLNSITEILLPQRAPKFEVGGYAEYNGIVALIEAIGISPYHADNREMLYVVGTYPEGHQYAGSQFGDYWPTGRVFRGLQ